MILSAAVAEVEVEPNAVAAVAEADLTYLFAKADLEVGEEEIPGDEEEEEVILVAEEEEEEEEEEGSEAVEIRDREFTRTTSTIPLCHDEYSQTLFLTRPGGKPPQPAAKVTKIENEVAKTLAMKSKKALGEARLPERPGYGTQGEHVVLYANYFDLQSVGSSMFRYHVEVDDKQLAKKKLRQVIRLFLEEHFSDIRNNVATDYGSNLISRVELPEGQYDVRYRDENGDYPERPKVYRVRCQFTGHVNPSDLLNYLTSTSASAMFHSKEEICQAMNIVMGHYPKSNPSAVSIGVNKHFSLHPDLKEKQNLGAGLEVLRGFFLSVRAATARILVNVQVRYAACYQEGPLGNLISEYQRESRGDIYRLEAFLKRLRVRVTHITRKNKKGEIMPRMKTIARVASRADGKSLPHPPKVPKHGAGPKEVEFFLESPGQSASGPAEGKKGKKPAKAGPAPAGKYISVAEFFKKGEFLSPSTTRSLPNNECIEYGKNVNPAMPVVNVGTRETPSYLPVEVCEVEAGQPAKAKLTPNQTRNMLNFAVRGPAQNAHSIVGKGTAVLGFGESTNSTLVSPTIHAPTINKLF